MAKHVGSDALRGTIDLLILRSLRGGPNHGWGIAQRIHHLSSEVLEVNQGSLYPALQRLEYRGWVKGEWGRTDEGRRARYYELTATGRRAAEASAKDWRRHAAAVEQLLSVT